MSGCRQDSRIDLAARNKWNIGYFRAGLVFWLHAAVIGWVVSGHVAKVYWPIGAFFMFSMAIPASRVLGADPFSNGKPLGEVVGYTHMSVFGMTLPVIPIAAFRWATLRSGP
jgi:hypothetical protein